MANTSLEHHAMWRSACYKNSLGTWDIKVV